MSLHVRFSILAATPVEADVLLESGVWAVPRCRPAPPPAPAKRSSCATATRAVIWARGVLRAVENVNTDISEAMMGLDAQEQTFLDRTLIELDGTEDKSHLSANAILAVSMAVARAAADESGLSLYRYFGGSGPMSMPVPMMNVINGGAHANNTLDLQELMILPIGAKSFRESLRMGAETFHALKKLIHDQGMSTAVGDEGSFAPNVQSHEAAIRPARD